MVFHKCVLSLLLLLTAISMHAQEPWLPPDVREMAVKQTVERLTAIRPVSIEDRNALASKMRNLVMQLSTRLETWSVEGTLKRSPTFPKLALPTSENKHLDAMARYQVCNWALINQQQPYFDKEARGNAALATTAISLAVIYLRRPYADEGGNMADVEPLMTGPAMTREFNKVMKNTDLLAHVEGQCQPVITELFTVPQ